MKAVKSPHVNKNEKKQGVCEWESSYLHLKMLVESDVVIEFNVPALQGWVQKPARDSGFDPWELLVQNLDQRFTQDNP